MVAGGGWAAWLERGCVGPTLSVWWCALVVSRVGCVSAAASASWREVVVQCRGWAVGVAGSAEEVPLALCGMGVVCKVSRVSC